MPTPSLLCAGEGWEDEALDRVAILVDGSVAILISGDGDFAPAVEAVKQLGKHVELGRVSDWPCSRLRDVCDLEVPIDEALLKDCWM